MKTGYENTWYFRKLKNILDECWNWVNLFVVGEIEKSEWFECDS